MKGTNNKYVTKEDEITQNYSEQIKTTTVILFVTSVLLLLDNYLEVE